MPSADDTGSFLIGLVTGGIVMLFLVTSTGRGILRSAGRRTSRYIGGG